MLIENKLDARNPHYLCPLNVEEAHNLSLIHILVPELPDSPFLINEKTGKRIHRINGKRKMV